MKTLTHSFAVRQQQGFEVYELNNEEVELAVVPELGAKIVSLKNRRTGREWMWHPPDGLKIVSEIVRAMIFRKVRLPARTNACRPSRLVSGRDGRCRITANFGTHPGALTPKRGRVEF